MYHSHELFEQAQRHIPGGVNSPVRAFRGVGGEPIFFRKGEGAYLYAEDGTRYIDYVGSWGPMIAGHAHPDVIEAVVSTARNGLSFGAPTVLETRMADRVCELVPSLDLVRMVNSGTEATMSAIRLARGFTGRDKIVKFEGCYHGHSDSLLVKAGSGALTLGVPSSPGVPAALAEHTLTLPYNDLAAVCDAFAKVGGLRDICDEYESVLIFDEVMTGFRVALGGAQSHYAVEPDLTTLGKVIGGGMPVGAFGGKREIMEQIAPLGPIYQAGTLSGNPVAMAAGLATLEIVSRPGFYEELTRKTEHLVGGILEEARKARVPMTANTVGGMFGLFFTEEESVSSYTQVVEFCDVDRFKLFFHGMLNEGIYLAPSAFEAGFVSGAHSDEDIDATIAAAGRVLATL